MTVPAGSQAVDRAAALLAIIVESGEPRTFTSLVDELGLAKSTTSRLLHALERNRLVRRDRAGLFRPGPLFAVYAAQHDTSQDLLDVAQATLDEIGERTGETVNLAVPRGEEVVQVAQVDASYLLGVTNWLDVSVPPHCSALGKIFYAYQAMSLPDELSVPPSGRSMSRRELEADLAETVRRGWALTWEEFEEGLVAVAAPVRTRDGSVVAAVSVSCPTTRITKADAARLGEQLTSETLAISRQLGYRSGKAKP
ncbi:IclR family transcriptional regulator [Actinophytocola sp.]|uniref:IclR family transcriptional regulator n=1 Tax=Actinophytocola sp. TaxID=1872138 RepID=UPI003D6C33D2